MKKIAVLISNAGTGTNLQAIIDGIESGQIAAKIVAVISDIPGTQGLERAKKHKLLIKICPNKTDLLPLLNKLNPDLICLAGWKQIILDEVIDSFPGRILNTHPGLIPDSMNEVAENPDGTPALWNKGKMTATAMQNFLDGKYTYAGCTNHLLSHEFDFGVVFGRCFEKIRPNDTANSLYTRLKVKENKLYVDVLAKLCSANTVLIVDGGGRGAALVDKYARSEKVGRILVVPGNDLMQINASVPVITYQHLKTVSIQEILEICKKEKVDLADVAQDNAVEAGLADEIAKLKIPVFGPTKLAGQIEWDKAWARTFMQKYQLPSPKFQIFESEKEGIEFVKRNPKARWFIKAAGLAEGKGVIPAESMKEAILAIGQMQKFGTSGKKFLLEEWLTGEEFSAFALCDGDTFRVVGYAQDHKRVNDGDKGPNTGGMGCVSNPLVVDGKIKKQIEKIFKKTTDGLKKEGRPYTGILYLGGMVVSGQDLPAGRQVYIIEFNARWGDPEAEVLLPSIRNDYFDLANSCILGKLKNISVLVDRKIRVAVAITAKGYPVDYKPAKGKKVQGIEKAKSTGVKVYGAGIKKIDGDYAISGGRVLYLVGGGKDVTEARTQVYNAIRYMSIEGNNLHFRTDIGWRDLERVKGKAERGKL